MTGLSLQDCSAQTSCFMVLYIYSEIVLRLRSFLYLLVSQAWWDWPSMWLTNHCRSVLWRCWLGHMTGKIVSEMTYNVSNWMLNPPILYYTAQTFRCRWLAGTWICISVLVTWICISELMVLLMLSYLHAVANLCILFNIADVKQLLNLLSLAHRWASSACICVYRL